MLNYCEVCGKSTTTKWYLVDENMETELCTPCAKSLLEHCEVERLT